VFFELADLNYEFEDRWAELQEKWRELRATAEKGDEESKPGFTERVQMDVLQLGRWFEGQLIDINRRHTPIQYNPIAYSYFTLDQPMSDSEGVRQYVHFHRHGESLQTTQAKDSQGDIDSWDKIARTEKDFRLLAYGKGPIKPFAEDVVHRQLLQLVICYESERLGPDELAECFDEYCSCEKESHDADALRKMRARFEAELGAS
jgi:hypothetical protein